MDQSTCNCAALLAEVSPLVCTFLGVNSAKLELNPVWLFESTQACTVRDYCSYIQVWAFHPGPTGGGRLWSEVGLYLFGNIGNIYIYIGLYLFGNIGNIYI